MGDATQSYNLYYRQTITVATISVIPNRPSKSAAHVSQGAAQ